MTDLVMLLVVFSFFGLCSLVVRGCEHLAYLDDAPVPLGADDTERVELERVELVGVGVVSVENAIGLLVAIILVGYLGFALLFPERL